MSSSIGTLFPWVGQRDNLAEIGTFPPKSGQLTCLHSTAFKIETVMTILETYNLNIPRNKQNNTRTTRTNCGAPSPTPCDGGGTAQRSACTQWQQQHTRPMKRHDWRLNSDVQAPTYNSVCTNLDMIYKLVCSISDPHTVVVLVRSSSYIRTLTWWTYELGHTDLYMLHGMSELLQDLAYTSAHNWFTHNSKSFPLANYVPIRDVNESQIWHKNDHWHRTRHACLLSLTWGACPNGPPKQVPPLGSGCTCHSSTSASTRRFESDSNLRVEALVLLWQVHPVSPTLRSY